MRKVYKGEYALNSISTSLLSPNTETYVHRMQKNKMTTGVIQDGDGKISELEASYLPMTKSTSIYSHGTLIFHYYSHYDNTLNCLCVPDMDIQTYSEWRGTNNLQRWTPVRKAHISNL